MAKTRAEIQKAYRERKKLNDPQFLQNERNRQAKYRVPASEKSAKKLKTSRQMNRIYCATYRHKQKIKKLQEQHANNTNITAQNTSGVTSTQCEDISSSTDIPTSSSFSGVATRSTVTKLVVQLPFKSRSKRPLRKSRALRKARKDLSVLQNKLRVQERSTRKWQKRFERLKNKTKPQTKAIADIEGNLTPRSKTNSELRKAGVSPRSLPRSIVRKLQLSNCLFDEIKTASAENTTEKKSMIKAVISGRIIKKYRYMRFLSKVTGIRRDSKKNTEPSKIMKIAKRRRQPAIKTKLLMHVSQFFERDEVSRCMPGKKDVKKVEGEKRQTRILNDYLSNLYEKFCIEEPTVKVAFSTFCKLRPSHIKVTSLLSRNTCLCTIHQNMALKLKSLRSHGINISPNPEVVKKTVTLEEMNTKLTFISEGDVEFEEWGRVELDGKKKMRIVKVVKVAAEFKTYMLKQYELFLQHVQRVSTQYKALNDLKDNLPGGHVIVQMDFAENFTCQTLDEIQSAYWNATSVTIHPVVAYAKSENGSLEHKNLAFISEVNNHNSNAVLAIIRQLVPQLKEAFPETTYLHYWTDSPSSQYRNRYMFDVLSRHKELFGVDARWNYFECGHGKGPCDGIGGTCKRRAAEAIKQGKAIIQDGKEFYQWAHKNEKSIAAYFYSQEDYDSASGFLLESAPRTVPGTMKTHAVIPTENGKIKIRNVSCYCRECLTGTLCDGWIEHTVRSIPKEAEKSTSAAEVAVVTENSTLNLAPNNVVGVLPSGDNTALRTNTDIRVDAYVGAVYDGDWYIGKVKEIEDDTNDVFISFMTKHLSKDQISFSWPSRPEAEEILVIPSDVLCLVEPPLPTGRSKRFFKLSDTDQQIVTSEWESWSKK